MADDGIANAVPATIKLDIPKDGLTKVALNQDPDNPDGVVKLTWESTDKITVEDAADETRSVEFVYKSGAGTSSAEFTTSDVTPISGATSYNIYLTSGLPGGYANQTQASDASTTHLGYAATLKDVNTYDGALFSQSWATANGDGTFESSSVLRIRAQMPTTAIANAVQKVIVKSSLPIFDEGNELTVTITTPGVADKVVTVYATLPAGNVTIPAGTEILFQFQVSADANDKYTAYRKATAARSLQSGQVNSFKINCPGIQSFAGPDDDGSEAHPYLIGDRHQMDAMHTLLGDSETKYFKMVDDVDIAAISHWEPLIPGFDSNRRIYFNGDNHIISHLTADNTYGYPSFVGYLWGEIKNVVFDSATITSGTDAGQSCAVVAGYVGSNSHQGDISGVTVRNSTLTSGGSNAYVGGIAARVGKSSSFTNCHIVNTTINGGNTAYAGGLIAYLASNCATSIVDCSAERISISSAGGSNINTSGVGGLIGLLGSSGHSINKCHTTGTFGNTQNCTGGLVGIVTGTTILIKNSYSTCTVKGRTYSGGLVGHFDDACSATVDHCFASGDVNSSYGYGGEGGLVGAVESASVTISNSVAWNSLVKQRNISDYSSGAVVGYAHPNCVLTDNYRKPGTTFTNVFWVPSASFDHANVNGTTAPLQRIDESLNEGALTTGDASVFGYENSNAKNYKRFYAYHGKHLASGAVVEPSDKYGWVSNDISGGSDPDSDPEAAGWSDTPTLSLSGATTVTVCPGVEYTHFHGEWEEEYREINIIRTTLNDHNSLGIYYNYNANEAYYLNEKCVLMDAVAGTNGSMACCQFVRVDDVVKHGVTATDPWIANCALTIDGGTVNIVKVDGNSGAAMLPNSTVSCAGPLLVWKGNIQTIPQEWKDADTDDWLTTTNPRTAIGLSKDGKTVIQVAVDGRWTFSDTNKKSIGMSVELLARLMKGLGCYKAMNFDGGGGTAMWVYGQGDSTNNIVNHPHNASANGKYYWTPVTLRPTGSAVYIHSDLK